MQLPEQGSAHEGGPQHDAQGEITLSSTGYVEWFQLFSFGMIPGLSWKKKQNYFLIPNFLFWLWLK